MTLTPPAAKKIPAAREHHGDTFIDNYEWLRDKENPDVRAYLEAENAYTDAVTEHQQQLRDEIFSEIKRRTQETDLSVPSRKNNWWYYSRTEEGRAYSIHCRVEARDTGDELEDWTPPAVEPGVPVAGEQVLLDGNKEAEGKPFFSVGGAAVTEDGNLYAYAADFAGDERFTTRIKDLRTGELLPDTIENVFYGLAFSPDGTRLFYTVVDESWRPYQVKAHVLGTAVEDDVVVYQEDDVAMWTGFEISADKHYLVISIGCSEYSETRVLDLRDPAALQNPGAGLRTLVPREARILYEAEPVVLDHGQHFVLTHNRHALNSMVSLVPAEEFHKPLTEQFWETVIAHDDTVRINGATVTRTHLLVSVRENTIETVRLIPLQGLGTDLQHDSVQPDFAEELFTCNLAGSDYESPQIRLSYTSFLTPPRIYDYVLASGELLMRKETPVLGGYDASRYVAERAWATASDGTSIPLSIVRRTELKRDGSNPAVIYGYGSYEISMDPAFAVARLSLLDRGIIFVIAHVRGGGELGRRWYEDGKKLNKMNTFTDFIDATGWLTGSGWVDPSRIAAMGGSAGGLLMGAVANRAPEKYAAILAQVPFVDPLTTVLDPDLPLSALEWEEWGNPLADPAVYAYMKSYSPYENVRQAAYPKIAAVTSFNDTRVLYVEPAKWVAALREAGTSDQPVLLKTEMEAGHGGASGRYEQWKTRAWDYAFLADALGAIEPLS